MFLCLFDIIIGIMFFAWWNDWFFTSYFLLMKSIMSLLITNSHTNFQLVKLTRCRSPNFMVFFVKSIMSLLITNSHTNFQLVTLTRCRSPNFTNFFVKLKIAGTLTFLLNFFSHVMTYFYYFNFSRFFLLSRLIFTRLFLI